MMMERCALILAMQIQMCQEKIFRSRMWMMGKHFCKSYSESMFRTDNNRVILSGVEGFCGQWFDSAHHDTARIPDSIIRQLIQHIQISSCIVVTIISKSFLS